MKNFLYLVVALLGCQCCSKPVKIAKSSLIVRDGLVLPLEGCDFSAGKWKATLRIDTDDFATLDPRVKRRKVQICESSANLEAMRKSWMFNQTEGDMATVTSSILLQKDGKDVFSAGVILSKGSAGLQAEEFGWAPAVDERAFFESLGKFN